MLALEHTVAGFKNSVSPGSQTVKRKTNMKQRTVLRRKQSRKLPIAWREAEYSALRASAADAFDDRVS
jgi:hypothetical protein